MRFLAYLFCHISYPFSFLFPRSRKKYVFGSFRGTFNDNAKYLFIYWSSHFPEDRCVWLSQNRDTVKRITGLGFSGCWVFSPKGLWYALTSKYWFVNAYSSDIFYGFSGGAEVVNLWHGLTIKRIEFGIKTGELSDRFVRRTIKERFYHPESFRRPDYVLSSSSFQSKIFAEDFRIKESRCLNLGYPRNFLLQCKDSLRKEYIDRYESEFVRNLILKIKKFSKSYIYMPTWRDSQRNIFVQHMNMSELNALLLEQNGILLLKPHANTFVEDTNGYSNILFLDSKLDIYPLLKDIDVMISDYSSVIIDFMLMQNKSMILYLYDFNDYKKERDFEIDYEKTVPGIVVHDFKELISAMKNNCAVDENSRIKFINLFWGKSAGMDSSAEIIKFVKNLN